MPGIRLAWRSEGLEQALLTARSPESDETSYPYGFVHT